MTRITNQYSYRTLIHPNFKARVGNPTNFPSDITNAIMDGRIYDCFVPTPKEVIRLMIQRVGGISNRERVLEPSAGYGHILDSILDSTEALRKNIDAIEPNEMLRSYLSKKGANLVGFDILQYNPGPIYDKILMNPPFDDGSDIMHVLHCFKLLKPGGKLAAILPDAAFIPLRQARYEFWERDWLRDGNNIEINEHLRHLLVNRSAKSTVLELDSAFLQSNIPDDIKTRLIIVEKPESHY